MPTLGALAQQEVLLFNDGYRTRRDELGEAGFRILRVAQVREGYLDTSGEGEFVRSDHRARIGAKLAEAGDIVLTTKGTVGRRARLSPDAEGVVYSPQVCFFRVLDTGRLDRDFLYYWLGSPSFHSQLYGLLAQTDMAPYVNLRDLARIRLDLPPIEQQRGVGAVLGALDDKIELNRRMNETLEQLARCLFRSWFVRSDPAQGPSGTLPEIAELFPTEFVESPIGVVPKGWEVAPLSEHVEVVRGLSYRGADVAAEGMPLHNLNSVLEGGGYKYDGIKYYVGDFRERDTVKPGDLVVANTEQGFDYLLIGYPAIVPGVYGQEGLFSHHLYRLRPRSGSPVTARFLYLLLLEHAMRSRVIAFTNGTTVNMLAVEGLRRPLFPIPPRDHVARFGKIVAPMFELQERLIQESRTIAELRDLLLPKLISGELRVGAPAPGD